MAHWSGLSNEIQQIFGDIFMNSKNLHNLLIFMIFDLCKYFNSSFQIGADKQWKYQFQTI